MRKLLVLLALLLQVAALAWMAIDREWILAKGQTVFLRTAPIDPRDIFRGDFVRLNYEISTLSGDELADNFPDTRDNRRHKKIYVPLTLNERGLANPANATDIQPESGLYLRGRIQYDWRLGEENRRPDLRGLLVPQQGDVSCVVGPVMLKSRRTQAQGHTHIRRWRICGRRLSLHSRDPKESS